MGVEPSEAEQAAFGNLLAGVLPKCDKVERDGREGRRRARAARVTRALVALQQYVVDMLAAREKNMRMARATQSEDGAAWWAVEARRRESRAYVEMAIRRAAERCVHERRCRLERLRQTVWAVVAARRGDAAAVKAALARTAAARRRRLAM